MISPLITTQLRNEQDVVNVRQTARDVAELLGLDIHDQTRIATAVSEVSRVAVQYADHGTAVFDLNLGSKNWLRINICDNRNGLSNFGIENSSDLDNIGSPETGITAARRLMDTFDVNSDPKLGTSVVLKKLLSKNVDTTPSRVDQIARLLAKRPVTNADAYNEIKRQNQELAFAMDELLKREAEMTRLNQELDDTNRGVMALYTELEERAGYLQRTSDLKTNFLADMSHEFRTPLNAIISLSDILLNRYDGDLTTEQEQQVTLIRSAATALTDTVNDLLDIAKIEAGKTVIRLTEIKIDHLFDALRSLFKPIVAGMPIQLVFENPQDLPPIITDEGKVAQIVRNLLSNALKFTPTGEIKISAKITVEDYIEIEVSDTGVGIESEDISRIFEEFVQVEGSPNRTKGTGLGLPLSRKLARLLGGDLMVSSSIGLGSKFTVRLPLASHVSIDEPD